jgi:secreted trypsin-like serine protease
MAATTTPSVAVGHYVMFGIVSYGPRNCGTREQPGVYTKVSHYIDWIKDNIYE